MRKLSVVAVIQYSFLFMALHCQSSLADEILLSKQKMPGSTRRPGSAYDYYNEDLTRLLDVGACFSDSDSTISFVPPLDGTSPAPGETLCQSNYSMKLVLFDLQLVELKAIDALGGTFRAQLELVLHWVDSTIEGSNGTPASKDCSFPCDTMSPTSLCCDQVWVPRLGLPRCEIHKIKSSTPSPYVYRLQERYVSYNDCLENPHQSCYGRRIWYLNIDATCPSQMNFRDFPFDLQQLTIDILNPYASRTWFQLAKGFLKEHIDEDINDINLSLDGKIPGWSIKDITVSSSCLSIPTWQQTFWAQDNLLAGLMEHYRRQHDDITDALNPKSLKYLQSLKCVVMENLVVETDDSPTNDKCYITARDNYKERVGLTLKNYRECMAKNNQQYFYWNKSVDDGSISIPALGSNNIDTSQQNINRSFSILDLKKGQQPSNVYFPCAIEATASLTTPRIRVTIVVQRYIMFYVVKLILPTVACVAFTFSAFGLQPHQLMGRLTVVVPSAIALTALQGFVVSTDIPPVAYIAPSTYIILISYFVQLLIAFESVLVRWLHDRAMSANSKKDDYWKRARGPIRRLDLLLMFGIGLLYTITILLCTLLPAWRSSQTLINQQTRDRVISLWKDSSSD